MPSLSAVLAELGDLIRDPAEAERVLRMRWGGERVYLPPIDSRKDPARAEHARELAKRLPTGIVAQRTGLSVGYVRRLVRRK